MSNLETHAFNFENDFGLSGEPDIGNCIMRDSASARIIGFGETHGEPNDFAKLGASLMPTLKENGVSALAIESPDYFQKYLDRFNNENIDLQWIAQKFAHDQPGHCHKGSHISSPKQLETGFFKLILSARKCGIAIHAIDVESVNLISARETYLEMGLVRLLQKNERLAYWGGSNHLAKREQIDTSYMTLAERISQRFGRKSIFSILGITSTHFSSHPLGDALNKIVKPTYFKVCGEHEAVSQIFFAEFRGPNGENKQSSLNYDWELFQLKYADYDALIIIPNESK